VFTKAESDELRDSVEKFLASIPADSLSSDEHEDLEDILHSAIEQSTSVKPKRWILNAASDKVEHVAQQFARDTLASATATALFHLINYTITKM